MILISNPQGGIAYLEAVDALMSGLCMPLICAFETFGFIYAYRSHDFVSDMNIATEENTCSSRLGIQWQIIPFVCSVRKKIHILLLCLLRRYIYVSRHN